MSTNGDGHQQYHIRCVDAEEMPPVREGRGPGCWEGLCVELALRLERTYRGDALAVHFDDVAQARLAYHGVRRFFVGRFGPDHVEMVRRTLEDGGSVLYIRRGEGYCK